MNAEADFAAWLKSGIEAFQRKQQAEWEALPDYIERNGTLYSKDLVKPLPFCSDPFCQTCSKE